MLITCVWGGPLIWARVCLPCSLGCYIINCIWIAPKIMPALFIFSLNTAKQQGSVKGGDRQGNNCRHPRYTSRFTAGWLPLAVCLANTGKHSASSEVAARTFCPHRTVTLPSLQGVLHLCGFWCHRFSF